MPQLADRKWLYLAMTVAGLASLAVVAALFFSQPVRAAAHTGMFVTQVLDAPIRPQSWFTREPSREEVIYPRPSGVGVADIYRIPDHRRRAAVLLFLGANAAGRDDQDVINLGEALARAGFVVMFHWSPTMGLQSNIDPQEIENLIYAFQYLIAQDFVDQNRAGIGGFSVGGSFAMVAAADPRIRDEVAFVNSFGAYYDSQELFVQIASHARLMDSDREPWEVDRLTWLVFANELIEILDDPDERSILEKRFLTHEVVDDAALESLSAPAQIVAQLLAGTTAEEAKVLLERLPPSFQQQMTAISPSAHLSLVSARLLVMHDEGDLLIPVGESRRLAEALRGRNDFRYTETRFFDHVRPGERSGLWSLLTEGSKLYRHMYEIIRIAV